MDEHFLRKKIQNAVNKISTVISVKTIRIGSYKFEPKEKVTFSSIGMRIVAPNTRDVENVILDIQKNEIVKFAYHLSEPLYVIFIWATKSCGKYVRESLEMSWSSELYYDPSLPSEQNKRIILQMDNISEEAKATIKSIFPAENADEIRYVDAMELLERSSQDPKTYKSESIATSSNQLKLGLFDFTTVNSLDDWVEVSDTVRTVGKSKATFVLQRTSIFQNAVFFTMLNPQPNGAGFAGIRKQVQMNLSDFKNITIRCRGQGENTRYKVVLEHNGHTSNEVTYEHIFVVSISDNNFTEVHLKLTRFKPYFRGQEVKDVDPLNTSNITSFGIQIFGGVYSNFKQAGVSALIIEKISAV